ncbi:hypothetical protein [Zarconia navalis]|nr:hypothetical protein [Zarconia navalis]
MIQIDILTGDVNLKEDYAGLAAGSKDKAISILDTKPRFPQK